jgi:GxxExxY protein
MTMRTRVVDACRTVFSALGKGHSEAVYHAALEVQLRDLGIGYQREVVVPVRFNSHTVGAVRIDLVVEHRLVVELKAVASDLRWAEKCQLDMYLRTLNSHGRPPLDEEDCGTTYSGILVNFPQGQGRTDIEVVIGGPESC